jgi:hypothetical protein
MGMTTVVELIDKLDSCPQGMSGWNEFEDICIEILCYLFVPPLTNPIIQNRTYSGINRRDAVFPNRNFTSENPWAHLLKELKARLILFEFKNYDSTEIGKEEVNQTLNYMTGPMGNLAILCCSKKPERSAHIRRNSIFSEHKKAILFITKDEIKELLYIKERGNDPADLILDLLELFYLQHE